MNQEHKEQLHPAEQLAAHPEQETSATEGLTMQQVDELYTARNANLEAIKQWVNLKFYYRVAEKIKQEQEAFKRLLRIENAKQDILAEYSFVLDSAYFEQKFLS